MAPHLSHLPKVPLTPRELGELAQLLFEWPIKQAPRLALPLFILLATIMQASVIILFSITYKEPSEKLPAPPQIYFLPSDSAAARKLTPWLEANDPAVFSPLHSARAAFPSPPPLKYKPSYEDPPPPLRPLPPAPMETLQPPMLPILMRGASYQVIRESAKTNQFVATSAPSAGTIVRWQDELANRVPLTGSQGSEKPLALAPGISPPLYQVAISPEGLPTHCVLMESSGDPQTDEAVRIWILAKRFQPTVSSSWGRVIVDWGAGSNALSTNSTNVP